MTVYYGKASSFITKHHLHRNGNSWHDIKNTARPRYPWFEVVYNDKKYSRNKFPFLNEQPTVEIMLHRKHGLNGIELFSVKQIEDMIEMLQLAKESMEN